MIFNCMIAGVGGQGTVLASKLLASAAMKHGMDVRTTETIGMAQRGGSVVSHVRIGEKIYSPLIPPGKADVIIAFEPAEAVRQLPYLCENGMVIVCDAGISVTGTTSSPANAYEPSAMIEYLKANIKRLVIAEGRTLMLQSPKTLNVAILGAASQCGIFPFDANTINDIITEMLPERFWDINLKAFETGRQIGSGRQIEIKAGA